MTKYRIIISYSILNIEGKTDYKMTTIVNN